MGLSPRFTHLPRRQSLRRKFPSRAVTDIIILI